MKEREVPVFLSFCEAQRRLHCLAFQFLFMFPFFVDEKIITWEENVCYFCGCVSEF